MCCAWVSYTSALWPSPCSRACTPNTEACQHGLSPQRHHGLKSYSCAFRCVDDLDRAVHLRAQETLKKLCAEPAMAGWRDYRAAAFDPPQINVLLLLLYLHRPCHRDRAADDGQRAVFGRIGGEFMQHHPECNRHLRRQTHLRAADPHPRTRAVVKGRKFQPK